MVVSAVRTSLPATVPTPEVTGDSGNPCGLAQNTLVGQALCWVLPGCVDSDTFTHPLAL